MNRRLLSIVPILLAFLILNAFERRPPGVNEFSRLATMRALKDEGTLAIDRSLEWTHDWVSAGGHYYSNKLPGPALLGFPIFAVADAVFPAVPNAVHRADRLVSPCARWLLSMAVQVIPLLLVAAYGANFLMHRNRSFDAICFFLFAALFGNTAATLAPLYMGHTLSAGALLLGILLLLESRLVLGAVVLAFATLCDLSALPVLGILALLRYVVFDRRKETALAVIGSLLFLAVYFQFFAGGAVTALLSAQNPMFNPSHSVLGMFSEPMARVPQLLFGPYRSVLLSEAWIFVGLLSLCVSRRDRNDVRVMKMWCVASFLVLLLLNSSFDGWFGGNVPGPRYLSILFPVIALLTADSLDGLPALYRQAAFVALGCSILFRAAVFATTILVPMDPLLPFFVREIAGQSISALGFALFLCAMTLSAYVAAAINKKAR